MTNTDILYAIEDEPGITHKQLQELVGHDPRGDLRVLVAERAIESSEVRGVLAYKITLKGKRLLHALASGMGDYPTPREPVSREPYTGERWNVRQGSEPAHGYRRPLLIASKVQANAGVARV